MAGVALGLLLAACTLDPVQRAGTLGPDATEADRCRAVFAAIADAVTVDGTGDAEARSVPGHPYLRANRFLASFATAAMTPEAFVSWTDRLRQLGRDGVRVELANLGADRRARLDADTVALTGTPAQEAADRCGDRLLAGYVSLANAQTDLRRVVTVPDHYDDLQRLLGLYPLTALPVALGYGRWRAANLETFGSAPERIAVAGKRQIYRPAAGSGALADAEAAEILARARDNPLGIPDPSPADAARLLAAYAPVWIVDTISTDDRIGRMTWGTRGQDQALSVAPERAVTYHKLSWTRFGREILLQLNYMVWFPARPRQTSFDLLGGTFDAVIWRVTLDTDGRPLLYDSIHACGCYHLFFPVPPLVTKPGPPPVDIRERAEAPAKGPRPAPGERVAVWLASVSHYIQTVGTDQSISDDARSVAYELVPADQLRTLATPAGGTRSIYRPDGLVAGSERLERFLLWPMGIASAGAMRQWGTHATAFVGRRHFDDPWLVEDHFRMPRGGAPN